MDWVLFVFKVRLFISTYSSVFCKNSMTFPCKQLSFLQQTRLVSSANLITFSAVFMLDKKFSTYEKKMSGPKTVLCGTPSFTISQLQKRPLRFIFCLHLARNEDSISFASVGSCNLDHTCIIWDELITKADIERARSAKISNCESKL